MVPLSWWDADDDDDTRKVKEFLRIGLENTEELSASAITDLAVSLDQLVEQLPGDFIGDIAWVFLDIAEVIPHDSTSQVNLVRLMTALCESSGVRDPDDWKCVFFGEHAYHWAEGFYGGGCGMGDPDDREKAIEQSARWRNYLAFEARILKAGLMPIYTHALMSIAHALEYPDYGSTGGRIQNNPSPDLALNIVVDWLQIAGNQLFPSKRGREHGARPGPLWKADGEAESGQAFSPERWEFWAQRLREASKDETLSTQTRARVAEGANMIEERADGR